MSLYLFVCRHTFFQIATPRTVFLPHDATRSADYAVKDVRPSVRMSVCPFVTRRYSVDIVTHILKRFRPSDI